MKELFEKQDKEFEEKTWPALVLGKRELWKEDYDLLQSHISKIRQETYEQGKKDGINERFCFREQRDKCSCNDRDVWNEFWKDILENEDGSINVEQLKKELHDWHHVLDQIPIIYMELSGGILSKTGYWASQIMGLNQEQKEKAYEDGREETLQAVREEIDETLNKALVEAMRAEQEAKTEKDYAVVNCGKAIIKQLKDDLLKSLDI